MIFNKFVVGLKLSKIEQFLKPLFSVSSSCHKKFQWSNFSILSVVGSITQSIKIFFISFCYATSYKHLIYDRWHLYVCALQKMWLKLPILAVLKWQESLNVMGGYLRDPPLTNMLYSTRSNNKVFQKCSFFNSIIATYLALWMRNPVLSGMYTTKLWYK